MPEKSSTLNSTQDERSKAHPGEAAGMARQDQETGEGVEGRVLWVTADADATEFSPVPVPPAAILLQISEHELPQHLNTGDDNDILAAVISPGVVHPARLGRLLYRASPYLLLCFVAQSGKQHELQENLRRPLMGRRFRVLDNSERKRLEVLLREATERSRRRRRLRTTLDRANLQLKADHAADPQQVRRLAISERFLASILIQTPDAVFSVDLENTITSWNRAAEQLFGVQSVEGKLLDNAHLGDCAASLIQGIARCRKDRTLMREEILSRTATGAERHLDLSFAPLEEAGGGLIGVSVVVRDVTERKRALDQLWQREHQIANLVRLSPVIISRFDEEGRCIFVNEHWTQVTGRAPDEAFGDGWIAAIHPEDRETVVKDWKQFVREGGRFHCGYRYRNGRDKDVWVESRAARETGPSGALTGFIKTCADITERKRAEEVMREMNTVLEERVQERTAALSEMNQQLETFVYSVAHDLRSPVRSITGFTQLVLDDFSANIADEGKDFLQRVMTASHRMDSLIQDLLDYSRIANRHLARERVELDWVLDRVLPTLQPEAEKRGGAIEVETPLPHVVGHPAILEQTVLNLMTNALKFVAPEQTPRIRVFAERRGGLVRLWVEDNGIGIEPRYHDRVFGVFERLHGQEIYPGTGIGLAIVRKGVERMGGKVGIESEVGKGSRFWIELSAAD